MRVVITAGGTGGHIFPALALAGELKNMGHTVLYLGGRVGPEAALARDAGFDFLGLDVRGFDRGNPLKALYALALLPVALARALRVFAVFRPDAVVGAGGYASGPGCIAAVLRGIPLFLLEQNVFPGLVTRRMARKARRVYASFEGATRWLAGADVMVSGNPVRDGFGAPASRDFGAKEKTLLIMGGSQGARSINNAAMAAASTLAAAGVRVIHQTGKTQVEEVRAAYRSAGVSAVVEPFFADMAGVMLKSHLAVSRAGASTCAELALSALPAVLAPFPGAGGHQRLNAEELERRGAAKVIEDVELTGERLAGVVRELMDGRETLARMSASAREHARPDAARVIARDIARLAGGER